MSWKRNPVIIDLRTGYPAPDVDQCDVCGQIFPSDYISLYRHQQKKHIPFKDPEIFNAPSTLDNSDYFKVRHYEELKKELSRKNLI